MKARRSRGEKRTYPERGIHPPHAVVSRCKSGEGGTSPKATNPHTRKFDGPRWGLWLFFDTVAEGDFFGGPACAAAVVVSDPFAAMLVAAVGAKFRYRAAGKGLSAHLADMRNFRVRCGNDFARALTTGFLLAAAGLDLCGVKIRVAVIYDAAALLAKMPPQAMHFRGARVGMMQPPLMR